MWKDDVTNSNYYNCNDMSEIRAGKLGPCEGKRRGDTAGKLRHRNLITRHVNPINQKLNRA
jgi:hypothetical protein